MLHVKNDLNRINILHTGSRKSFPMHYGLWGKFFKAYFSKLINALNEMYNIFEMYNSIIHIQDHTKYFGYIIRYASKWLELYFELCYVVFNTFQQSLKIF